MVPGRAQRAARLARARLLRLERHRRQVPRHAHHLHRHRDLQLDLGPGRQGLLLAPLLQPPARSQLRQPARARSHLQGDALLARHGGRRLPPRRDSVSHRARRHPQREPARDARDHQAAARGHRRQLPESLPAGRGQPVAGRRARVFRRGRRVPHGVSLPADAAHVHGHRAGRPLPAHRDHGADARDPAELPVGHLPAQPRRAHARDGDEQGARLHVRHLRGRPTRAHQPRHPAAPRPADGQRHRPHQADEQPLALDAWLAHRLLRRRDRHGRQHLHR